MRIDQYLSGERDYKTGVDLYRLHDGNPILISILEKGETFYNRKLLIRELHNIKAAPSQRPVKPPITEKPERHGLEVNYPEELQPAVKQLQVLYNLVNHLHPQLVPLYNTHRGECHKTVQKLLATWKEIDEIYRVLDYWTAHQVILPHRYHPNPLPHIEDEADMLRRRNNLRTYISKFEGIAHKADKVAAWKKELKEIEARL